MKSTFVLVLLFLSFITSKAQEVISNAGDFNKNSYGSVSWTLGEPVTETFINAENKLTQGFQQSKLIITCIQENEMPNYSIKVYPNPAKDYIQIDFNTLEKDAIFHLSDVNGKEMLSYPQNDIITFIDITQMSPATYFLYIEVNKNIITTYKIIKQ